jgi:ABC-type phosphate transport system permease subunit
MQIYFYATAPYDDWHAQAWAGALVLLGLVLVISVAARFATRSARDSAAIENQVPLRTEAHVDAAR